MKSKPVQKRDWTLFYCSVFFVLGFSVIFSLVGVLLQSVLSSVSFEVQKWLGRIGGVIIIFFGLFLLGLVRVPFLEREHKLHAKTFKSKYITSFVFGAAFAVGWTPCVGAILGAILTLAAIQPGSAFILLMSYTIGLGLPFLLVGLFATQAQAFIEKSQSWIKYVNYVFGVVLILLGVLVFVNQLSRIANLQFVTNILLAMDAGTLLSDATLGLGISFIAGVVSFLSPCVLPLIPGFLAYLAALGTRK